MRISFSPYEAKDVVAARRHSIFMEIEGEDEISSNKQEKSSSCGPTGMIREISGLIKKPPSYPSKEQYARKKQDMNVKFDKKEENVSYCLD